MATAWFSPSMHNIVKQNGRDVHLVVMPDDDCVVNSGLGSTRGAKIAELSYSTVTGTPGGAADRAACLALRHFDANQLG